MRDWNKEGGVVLLQVVLLLVVLLQVVLLLVVLLLVVVDNPNPELISVQI